jgi:hypothetical protein
MKRRLLGYLQSAFFISIPVSALFFPVVLTRIIGPEDAMTAYLWYVGIVLAVLSWLGGQWVMSQVKEYRERNKAKKFWESVAGEKLRRKWEAD